MHRDEARICLKLTRMYVCYNEAAGCSEVHQFFFFEYAMPTNTRPTASSRARASYVPKQIVYTKKKKDLMQTRSAALPPVSSRTAWVLTGVCVCVCVCMCVCVCV